MAAGSRKTIAVLDGPMGTELARRGVATPLPGWSAHALTTAPDTVADIHRDYANAGATVHTANTFRTRHASIGPDWRALTRRAVDLARAGLPPGSRLLGSIAPVADCYRPDLSRPEDWHDHARMAEALAEDGVDGLLCETFPHGEEALAAVRAATATGLSTWLALTPGPDGSLLTPADLAAIGVRARDLGAHHVLVNCVAASRALAYVQALVAAGLPAGAYGNAGQPDEATGWRSDPGEPERYAEQAAGWIAAGAEVVGGCCGTGPEHVAAIVFRERARKP